MALADILPSATTWSGFRSMSQNFSGTRRSFDRNTPTSPAVGGKVLTNTAARCRTNSPTTVA